MSHAFLALALTLVVAGSAAAGRQPLDHHVPLITKRLTPLSRMNGEAEINLAIGLPLRDKEKLTNFLGNLYQPSHPDFRKYLSSAEFAKTYGPTEEDYQAVVQFAREHHLTVRHQHANRTLLDVRGRVADIERAFHLHMMTYQHPVEARVFYAPDAEPTLDLDVPVLSISGLNNYVRPRPFVKPMVRPYGGGSGGGGGGGGNSGPFWGYDFNDAYAGNVVTDGSGQAVGLFELCGYNAMDISDYISDTGLPGTSTLVNVLIDGYDGDDGSSQVLNGGNSGYLDYSVEVTSDIEMAISMAPNLSTVYVYEGPTPTDTTPLGTNAIQEASTTAEINDVFNRMAVDNLAHQLSCSYGMDINLSTIQIFQQFAAQGQSFFQAAGDSGAYFTSVDEPSDDPYLTIAGGTTLVTSNSNGGWLSEVVWLTPAGTDELGNPTPLEATGGGISLTYAIPVWQQGVSMSLNQGSTTMRNLPDVAMVANNVNVDFGESYGLADFGLNTMEIGGTSLAAPLWAAFMALVNQQAAANGQPPVGFINPALYAIGKSTNYTACFHDVTKGNNFNANSPSKFSAATGYDLCTGWGSMNGAAMVSALLAPPAEKLVIDPPLGFTSQGPGGGPFSVTSQTYTLTNIGSAALYWTLANTSRWLNVSASSGTLSPGGSAAVTVSLNTTATNFILGNYSGNVVFSNLTDGVAENREFDFYVGNGGFETGDFTYWTFIGDPTETFTIAGDDVDVGGTYPLDASDLDAWWVHSGLYGAYLGAQPNDASLSQALATKAGGQYLLSFWLTSIASGGETTPSDFTVKWNGGTVFYQTNLPAFGWTNMQYVVSATGAQTTLQFLAANVPGAFGLDDVSVQSIPAPVLQSVGMSNGVASLTWSTTAGLAYQLQSTTNLTGGYWTNVGAPVTASGQTLATNQAITTNGQRYYRVVLIP